MEKELLLFIEHLNKCVLLSISPTVYDYEKVIYNYMNYETDYSGTVITTTKKKREFKNIK